MIKKLYLYLACAFLITLCILAFITGDHKAGTDNNLTDWSRQPPDSYQFSVLSPLPPFASILQDKKQTVIKLLEQQAFYPISYHQIAEYCHECTFLEDNLLNQCTPQDHIYFIRRLTRSGSGPLFIYRYQNILYTDFNARSRAALEKNPWIICLDFPLEDVFTDSPQKPLFRF